MSLSFREARQGDLPAIVALLAQDWVGDPGPLGDLSAQTAAFAAMAADPNCFVIVGESGGRVVATYQLNYLTGISLTAARRAQIEGVRVADDQRGQGIGARLMADAEARARAAGCALMQLTTNRSRTRAHTFYDRLGFTASHIGYKRKLTSEGDD